MMQTETITVFSQTFHQVTSMEQLRYQGGRDGRGRRLGLTYYVRYTDESGTSVLLQQQISTDQSREEIETMIQVGTMYLDNFNHHLTMAAIKEEVK
jgi:hypothetical protein